MKAEELRIGNYVFENDSKIKQVEHIINNTIYTKSAGKQLHKPIPLTEQWLLDLGFEKYENQTEYDIMYELKKEDIEISVGFYKNEIHTFLFSGDCLYHINHVHTLQNLYFALTGKELTL